MRSFSIKLNFLNVRALLKLITMQRNWKNLLIGLFIILNALFIVCCNKSSQNMMNIMFNSPAACWSEAIPIGNGSIGGMVYGGINSDTITINEETLWSGEPRDRLN